MKRLDLSREHYLMKGMESLHKEDIVDTSLASSYDTLPHLILYGPPGCGKYTQSLRLIQTFSPSRLKYERKMTINSDKDTLHFSLSDIHIEVDFDMLGCHSKTLWHEIYCNYMDILVAKKNKKGIILIKNFSNIHNELHDIFYSYIQNYDKPHNCEIKYIILTENVSFIHNNILTHFTLKSIARPTKKQYSSCGVKKSIKGDIYNITNVTSDVEDHEPHLKLCHNIIKYILDLQNLNILELREHIYNLLIYNLNIHDCVWYINHYFHKHENYQRNFIDIMRKTVSFFQLYNNNYRPIYHLENYFVYLITIIHDTE